jgi:hypothetical protein
MRKGSVFTGFWTCRLDAHGLSFWYFIRKLVSAKLTLLTKLYRPTLGILAWCGRLVPTFVALIAFNILNLQPLTN